MRRFVTLAVVCVAGIGTATLVTACGDDEEETTTATEVETTTEEETTAEPTTTATEPTTTTGTGTTTTTTGPQDCGKGEVYSSSIGACVKEGEGKNPCPQGEVPMADQPVCVPKEN